MRNGNIVSAILNYINDTEQNETKTSDMGTKLIVSISMDSKKAGGKCNHFLSWSKKIKYCASFCFYGFRLMFLVSNQNFRKSTITSSITVKKEVCKKNFNLVLVQSDLLVLIKRRGTFRLSHDNYIRLISPNKYWQPFFGPHK